MASTLGRHATATILSAALLLSSTAAAAAPTLQSASAINPWATMAAFGTQASRATLCGSTAAVAGAAAATSAAQAAPARPGCVLPVVDAPPPMVAPDVVPPPPPVETGFGVSPLLLGLGALAIAGLIYLIVNDDDDGGRSPD